MARDPRIPIMTASAQASPHRSLTIAFTISLAFHTVVLGLQFIRLQRQRLQRTELAPLDIIYEAHTSATQELHHLQRQVAQLGKNPENIPSPPQMSAPMTHIRIPDRPALTVPNLSTETSSSRAAVIDLTNLVEAAQGNPVLLSYFGAIREQIQRTANQQTWMTGQPVQGVVYISFLLTSTGQVVVANVVADRSVSSSALQDIALRIVKASNPFNPFPPSMPEPSKTIVVPLEFLTGS